MNIDELGQIIEDREFVLSALCSVGERIIKDGKPYSELSRDEIEAALRHIVTTSESEDEIRRRVKDEFRCPYQPCLTSLTSLTAMAGEAILLCQAMGGMTMKNGTLVQLMIFAPDGEIIMM
jgi:hypothetical protein